MTKLVLLRHGESEWNRENRFTGWTDVDLSSKGLVEAHESAKLLKQGGYSFDIAFTSVLKRAIRTLWITLDDMDLMWINVVRSWQLNERHYGALQGLNKAGMVEKFGEDQVKIWRRSYDVRPPALDVSDPRFPGHDLRYSSMDQSLLPKTECLKDTVERVIPFYTKEILPRMREGKQVIIVAHGNSLRALVKYLDNVSPEKIVELNIPTGIPLVYELDDSLHAKKSYYLGDPEAVKKAIAGVKDQLKK